MSEKHSIPVALIIYKRPDLTRKLLQVLQKRKPSKLYVISDGARNASEKNLVSKTRKVIDKIGWKCEVRKNYSDTNLGLKKRIITGLDWVFQNEDKAIILEDDCLPNLDFFTFCKKLLKKYEKQEKVMSVSGISYETGQDTSYSFSKYPQCWGWATWKRAWQKFDLKMSQWKNTNKKNFLKKNFSSKLMRWYWKNTFDLTEKESINSWAYIWTFTHFFNQGLTIIPQSNLVSNLGFEAGATNTKITSSSQSKRKTENLNFPLKHPKKIKIDNTTDKRIQKNSYQTPIAISGLIKSIFLSKVKSILG